MTSSGAPRPERPELWSLGDANGLDRRACAPAASRNVGPILDTLAPWLPASGRALEVGSGTGQHIVALARRFPGCEWLPSDHDPRALESITAWVEHAALDNLRPPLRLDAASDAWPLQGAVDLVLAINVVHIAPWRVTEGLVRGAARHLSAGGQLVLYGPYRRNDVETAPSNVAFDRELRRQNPEWGVRQLEAFAQCALRSGLALRQVREMPANNLTVRFVRAVRASREAPGTEPR